MQRLGGVIDVSDWEFGCGDFDGPVKSVCTEVLTNTLQDEPPTIYLPWEYNDEELSGRSDGLGGPPVDDPLTLSVYLGIFSENNPPRWQTSLRTLAMEMIDMSRPGNGESFQSEKIDAFISALRALADDMEKECAKEVKS